MGYIVLDRMGKKLFINTACVAVASQGAFNKNQIVLPSGVVVEVDDKEFAQFAAEVEPKKTIIQ